MKVLSKTFDVLEYVINSKGHPVTPSLISSDLGMNASGCVRILADLVSRGYLQQISRNSGYVPGPAVFTFRDRLQWNYVRIYEAARDPIDELSLSLGVTANLSVICGGIKYMLYHSPKVGERVLLLQTRYTTGFHNTATGRLLLGECSKKELLAIFALEQVDICQAWEGVTDLNSFMKAVQTVHSAGKVFFTDRGKLCIVGTLLRLPDLTAAIGFGCALDKKDSALQLSEQAVRKIHDNYTNIRVLL